MTTHCQPLPRSLAEEMLQVVARAICDRPGDNSAQRESRTRQMVYSTLGFEPRDGLEYMLSTIAFGHFQLILDSMRDVFQGQTDSLKARTKTTIVALDRAMLEMIRELRVVRRRPVAHAAEDARGEETIPPTDAPEAMVEAMSVPEPVAASPIAPDAPAEPEAGTLPKTAARDPRPARSGDGSLARAFAMLTPSAVAASGATPATPVDANRAGVAPDLAGAEDRASAEELPPAAEIIDFVAPSAGVPADGTFEEHIAAFEAACAATMELLAEAKANEDAKAAAATGD